MFLASTYCVLVCVLVVLAVYPMPPPLMLGPHRYHQLLLLLLPDDLTAARPFRHSRRSLRCRRCRRRRLFGSHP